MVGVPTLTLDPSPATILARRSNMPGPSHGTSGKPIIAQFLATEKLFYETRSSQFRWGLNSFECTDVIRFDYLAPFNPRGDFYQSPSSSSAGSAVASTAYSWLDFTIGTDTGGSIRHPAGVCGVYGLRPSTRVISTTGIYTVSTILDSVGLLARSASIIKAAFTCMLKQSYSLLATIPPRPKYKLLYPIRAKGTNPEHSRRWFPFPGEPGVATDAESRFENFIIGDFRVANQGRSPFIDLVVKARQAHSRQISATQNAAAMETAKMFSKWVKESVLAQSDESELPLLVFP